jgi:hypothetical protein
MGVSCCNYCMLIRQRSARRRRRRREDSLKSFYRRGVCVDWYSFLIPT